MIFIILLFLFLSVSPVSADDFNISGDGGLNEYHQTTAFSVSEYPNNSDGPNSISYDAGGSVSMNTDLAIQNHTISTLTALSYRKRIPRILDSIWGPPGTKIDILYFYLNDTGHSVNISKIVVPFSMNISDRSNLNNLVKHSGSTPSYASIDVSYNNRIVRKEGMLKDYPGLGIVGSGINGFKILDTVEIVNPLEVSDMQISENGDFLDMEITIKNKSIEKFNNVSFEHNSYYAKFVINAFEEITLQYSIPYSQDLGYYKITNPNIKTECAIYGSEEYNWLDTNAVTVLAYREDGGWVNGAYVQPMCESFCITRLPYSFTSESLRYEKIEEGDNMEVEDSNIQEGDVDNFVEEVLGIQEENFVLPKTAKEDI